MILDNIVANTKTRVKNEKLKTTLEQMKWMAKQIKCSSDFPFEAALKTQDINFICEVKKASPSKGIIAKEFPYVEIAKDYEKAGASCISVLTEPDFFMGSNDYLTEIKSNVKIPILRKDFIIDEYQIYQAKVIGADCILLIVAILNEQTIREYIKLCDELGLSALVEVHDEKEIECAISAGARMIGVNNRNLKTFEVNIQNSIQLRKLVPEQIPFIAESGIKTAEDIKMLREAKVNGVLIGETLMRSTDKKKMLDELRN